MTSIFFFSCSIFQDLLFLFQFFFFLFFPFAANIFSLMVLGSIDKRQNQIRQKKLEKKCRDGPDS